MARIIIFTGKGGVGKTTIAAAHARKASLQGKKTLIVSTDMAHNLKDLFECSMGETEVEVSKNLFALEIDPYYEMTHNFASMKEAFEKIIPKTGESGEVLDEIEILPGIEELFSLLKIQEIHEKEHYDLIIVDCAPTGETLALLKFPELLSWYMEKFFPLGKIGLKVMRPISKAMFKIELPNGAAMNDIERLYLKLAELQELIRNRDVTSLRLVTVPEKMVVEETKRNYMYLNLYNFNIDGLYINRILPRNIDNNFFEEWLLIQEYYINELKETFGEIPIYPIKWYDCDLNGLSSLDRVCEDSLEEKDIFEIKKKILNEVYEKTKTGYTLKIKIPFAKKEELELHEVGSELVIKTGNYKRNIPLPSTLRSFMIQSAKMEGETLRITFIRENEDE